MALSRFTLFERGTGWRCRSLVCRSAGFLVRPVDSLTLSDAGALQKTESAANEPEPEPLKPAVPVKKSVTPDYIICLEDEKKFKSLKRHIRTHYGLTPEEYRDKWDLDADYPMVAPYYAAARLELAKKMGLGQQRKRSKK